MKKPLFVNRGWLQVGQIVDYFGTVCEVVLVNDCRARLVPLAGVQVQIKAPITGETRATFMRPSEGLNIYPRTELPVLARSRKAFET